MKKAVVLILVLLFLTGCSGSNTPATGPSPSPASSPSPIPSPSPSPEVSATPSESEEPATNDTGDEGETDMLESVFAWIESEDYMPPEGFDKKTEGITYGDMTEVEYDSKTTGKTRKCHVYTPPGYDPNVTYPVLYLLHGIGGIHDEWLGGSPNEILSNLIASGEAPPMIVVIPNVRAMENDGYPREMLGAENIAAFDNFINDLRDDLMPFINATYPVSQKREECAIAGLSMGGRESLFIGFSMPDTFGYIGAFSPAPGLMSFPSLGYPGQLTVEEMTLPNEHKGNTFILIVSGNQDGVVNDVPNDYHKALEDNGIRHTFYKIDGGHDFTVWKNGLYYFAKCVFKRG